jgi:hypothetical protein
VSRVNGLPRLPGQFGDSVNREGERGDADARYLTQNLEAGGVEIRRTTRCVEEFLVRLLRQEKPKS